MMANVLQLAVQKNNSIQCLKCCHHIMPLADEQMIGTPALIVQFALSWLAKFKKKISQCLWASTSLLQQPIDSRALGVLWTWLISCSYFITRLDNIISSWWVKFGYLYREICPICLNFFLGASLIRMMFLLCLSHAVSSFSSYWLLRRIYFWAVCFTCWVWATFFKWYVDRVYLRRWLMGDLHY